MELKAKFVAKTKNYYKYEVQSPSTGSFYVPLEAFDRPPAVITIVVEVPK